MVPIGTFDDYKQALEKHWVVFYKMTLAALRTRLYLLFCLHMQDNCITFVFLTNAFMGVQTPGMI